MAVLPNDFPFTYFQSFVTGKKYYKVLMESSAKDEWFVWRQNCHQ
jgi:hypothetical protein